MDSPASSNGQAVAGSESGRRHKGDPKPLKLNSPFGADPIYFHWSTDPKRGCAADIIDTIRECFNILPELHDYFDKSLMNVDWSNYEQVRNLCKKFGRSAMTYWKANYKPGEKVRGEYAATDLLRIVCTKAYNRAVDDEKKLNKHYEAFSSQTYGETSFERLRSIIEEIEPKDSDVFVDLGSGVGQLVVQMAGGSKVKRAIGIEIADLPSAFAKKLEIEFKSLMRWFGKKYRPFNIHQGNFLDKQYEPLILQDATIIFINNYAFQADLETQIKKNLLSELKEGTRIISTKPYCSPSKGYVTSRQLSDISSILDVQELKRCPNPCSWTSNDVPYYLHVVNRGKLEHYFASLKHNSRPIDRRSGTPSTSSKSSESRESSIGSSKNGSKGENGDVVGPTTRRKWSQYVNEQLQPGKTEKSYSKSQKSEQEKTKTVPVAEPETSADKIDSTDISIPTVSSPPLAVTPESAAKARAANIADTIDSVADGTASTVKQLTSGTSDVTKPTVAKKRGRKEPAADGRTPARGRPRKNAPPTEKRPRLSFDAQEGIDIMHKMTSEGSSIVAKPDDESNFAITQFSSSSRPAVEPEMVALHSKYPNLDIFMDELKSSYVKFLDSFHTEDFIDSLRKRDALRRAQPTVSTEQFKSTLRSVGVNPDDGQEKISKAKLYLQRYNRCAELAHALELEMFKLERDSQALIEETAKCNIPMTAITGASTSNHVVNDQHMVVLPPKPLIHEKPCLTNVFRGGALPNGLNGASASLDSISSSVPSAAALFSNYNLLQTLAEPSSGGKAVSSAASSIFDSLLQSSDLLSLLNSTLTNGNVEAAPSFTKPETNGKPSVSAPLSISTDPSTITTTYATMPQVSFKPVQPDVASVLKGIQPVVIPVQNGITSMHQQPIVTIQTVPTTSTSMVNGVTRNVNGDGITREAAIETLQKVPTAKKSRSRSARAPANKKNNARDKEENQEDKEDVELTVNKIVQIALDVDKVAKTNAENQRKARSSEKRAKEKAAAAAAAIASATSITSSVSTTTSTTATVPISPKKQKRTSNDVVVPVSSASLPCVATVAPLPINPSSSAQTVLPPPPSAASVMASIASMSASNHAFSHPSPSVLQIQPPPPPPQILTPSLPQQTIPAMFSLPSNFFPTNATPNLAENLNIEALKSLLNSVQQNPSKNVTDLLQMALNTPTYNSTPTPPPPALNSAHFASLFSNNNGGTHPLLSSLSQAGIDRLSSTPTPSIPPGSNGQF